MIPPGGAVPKVCQAPLQERTASAPPTPEHPEGVPRSASPGEFPPLSEDGPRTHSDGWMPGTTAAPVVREAPDASPSAGAPGVPGALELCFDAPLEEVLALSTEAFGQLAASLSSPKWDRRVQALKGVGMVLKGLDIKANPSKGTARGLQLRDHARCFRAACLILHITMRDKVLPVLFAAHELYCLAFEYGHWAVPEAEACFAMGVLMQHLLVKLGELNIRLHESACTGVAFSAGRPFFGLREVFSRLRSHLDGRASSVRGPQRLRAQAGVLDIVGQLLRRFPGRRAGEGDGANAVRSWTAADVAPFIISGITVDGVTGLRVQQAAVSLAVIVVDAFGKRALDPVMADLNPTAKDMLVARLEEERDGLSEDGEGSNGEDDDDDDGDVVELTGVDGLCILGVGLRPMGPKGVSLMDQSEECIMDEILEATGLVFGGQALPSLLGPSESALDEDLRGLGFEGLLN